MGVRLYRFRNFVGVAANYAIVGGLAAASYAIAQPWMIVTATVTTGGLMYAALRANKHILENELKVHPAEHPDSLNLGKMVRELYKKSGLKADEFPVYDFAIKHGMQKKKDGVLNAILRIAMDKAKDIPNAAALNLGKPIIMISEPLLKLLTEPEEKAVLAHEFAHAAALHQHISIPSRFAIGSANIANIFSVFGAALAQGFWTFLAGVVAGSIAVTPLRKLHPHGDLLEKDNKDLNLKELYKKKQAEHLVTAFNNVSSLGIFTYINPAFAPIWVAAKGISITSKLSSMALSRSFEYQADRGAVELGANPLALISALRKISALQERSIQRAWGNEPVPKPGNLRRIWKEATSTHPKLERRIARLADMARSSGYSEEDIHQTIKQAPDISKGSDIPYEVLQAMASRFV